MTKTRKYRGLKIAGIVLLILLTVAGGVMLYISLHYKRILREKLPVVSAKATDSLYTITATGYSINIFNKSFSILGLHMHPNPVVLERLRKAGKGPHVLLDITVPEVEIAGLQWNEVAVDKEVVCDRVDIYRPEINITITGDNPPDDSLAEKKTAIDRVFASNIMIKDPVINYQYGSGDTRYTVQAKGGMIRAEDWDFHPREQSDSSRFFYARTADVMLNKIVYNKPGSLYVFGIDTVHFVSADHDLQLFGAYVRPSVGKHAFYKSVNKQTEMYTGHFPHARLNDFQWEALITRQYVAAGSLNIMDPDLEILLSRFPPPNTESKVGNYPQQLLQKLNLPIHIPAIHLQRGSFRYKEENEKTHLIGTLDFSNVHGQILNVTNVLEVIAKDAHCRIELKGNFMRKSPMQADFDLLLTSKVGQFTVKGHLGELEASQITDAAKALALAEIKSLKLHALDFTITGNDTVSDGHIAMKYDDLKIKLQRLDTSTRQLRGRGLISFLANELLLYNDNPMVGEDLRKAVTHVQRDPTKSFFNLIWRNLFNAGIQTAIRQEGMADIVKKKQAKKGKEKVHFFRKLFPKRKKNSTKE